MSRDAKTNLDEVLAQARRGRRLSTTAAIALLSAIGGAFTGLIIGFFCGVATVYFLADHLAKWGF